MEIWGACRDNRCQVTKHGERALDADCPGKSMGTCSTPGIEVRVEGGSGDVVLLGHRARGTPSLT